jgi:pilus assembly protein CpaB
MQNRQAIFFLALAVILGLGAALSAERWLRGRAPLSAAAPVPAAPVVIAKVDVPVGVALDSRQLGIASWPAGFVPAGAIGSIEQASGRVPRRPLAANEPVLEAALLPQGSQAGLVAVIEDGKRALSVRVDPVIGVAGFIKPGSRVDVVATLRRIDLDAQLPYTHVILQDVRVLAIDQKLEGVENGEAHLVSVVTLEVDPQQSEHLTYISHEGHLQLALRNPGDHDEVKTRSTGVADLLPARGRRSVVSTSAKVEVLKGSSLSTSHF